MSNIVLKRYISKNLVNLFKTENFNIAYCEIVGFSRNNVEFNKISDNASDFDAIIDVNNNIHLIYQNKDRSIIYEVIKEKENFKTEILKARSGNFAEIGKFRLFGNNKYSGAFYIIKNNDKNLLCCQFLKENTFPEVIGLICENFYEYIPLGDSFGNLYVIFCDANSSLIGVRMFKWSEKRWMEFKTFEVRDNIRMLSAFIDEKNILHICYKSGDGLYYKNAEISFDNFKWSGEKLLTRQHIKASLKPIINKMDGVLMISWVTFEKIIAVMSADDGETWSKLRELSSAHGNEMQVFEISTPLKSLNCEFYGFVSGNKLNIPMLGRFIDDEFEKENVFNNDYIGKIHNVGYDAEMFVKKHPISYPNKPVLTVKPNNESSRELTKSEIERIKIQIAEKIKAENTSSKIRDDIANNRGEVGSDEVDTKTYSLKTENQGKTDLKYPLEKICDELKVLNSSLNCALKCRGNRTFGGLKRANANRKKAILLNMHTKLK